MDSVFLAQKMSYITKKEKQNSFMNEGIKEDQQNLGFQLE